MYLCSSNLLQSMKCYIKGAGTEINLSEHIAHLCSSNLLQSMWAQLCFRLQSSRPAGHTIVKTKDVDANPLQRNMAWSVIVNLPGKKGDVFYDLMDDHPGKKCHHVKQMWSRWTTKDGFDGLGCTS